MDADTFTHPAHSSRREKRKSQFSLGPLTTHLPLRIEDYEEFKNLPSNHISYLAVGSTPNTPRPQTARSDHLHVTFDDMANTSQPLPLSKSKSTSHLTRRRDARPAINRRSTTNNLNNGNQLVHRKSRTNPPSPKFTNPFSFELPSPEWLLRVGAALGAGAREGTVGESWLLTRPSSDIHVLRHLRTPEEAYAYEDADEYALVRESILGPTPGARSRRGSFSATGFDKDGLLPLTKTTTATSSGGAGSGNSGAATASAVVSAAKKRRKGIPLTPSERRAEILAKMEDGYYFDPAVGGGPNDQEEDEVSKIPGPDFVGVDEPLESDDEGDAAVDPEAQEAELLASTEAYVRNEVKNDWFLRSWFVRPFVSSKYFEESDDEEESEDGDEGEGEISDWEAERRRREEDKAAALKRLQECTIVPLDTTCDPPAPEDTGVLSDAVWLLGVAAKALWG
ncbi:hypothetical protein VTJ04DRAFT_9287 [Mycothermus thermophilus]|uniref:uncharacterized protein n=1 Tax=Humicola insolens TaxID=85995 RepID=UPI0037428DEB